MPKDDVLRIRIATSDKRAISAAARREHLAMSQWVRRLLLIAARQVPPQTRRPPLERAAADKETRHGSDAALPT